MKIVLFGAESCGKTTLALQIAKHFAVPVCPEYVREYLQRRNLEANRNGIISIYDDILPMSIGQAALEASFQLFFTNSPQKLQIYDTNIETNWIYSKYYFQKTPQILDNLVSENSYDLYLLLKPDIPWVADGLRDSPTNRTEMHLLFKNYLYSRNRNFVEIAGNYTQRLEMALHTISNSMT
jgi:NadR type nicotinamide-nucleotide adenylyltransferase